MEEQGADVIGGILVTVVCMTVVIFAKRLAAAPGLEWLAPLGRLAWPWYVPLGTTLTVATAALLSLLPAAAGARTSTETETA